MYDRLCFDLVNDVVVAHKMCDGFVLTWLVMLLFVDAHKVCDGFVLTWLVMLLFVVAHKVCDYFVF